MTVPRAASGVAIWEEKITVAGGWQTEVAKVWSSVEQYDDASGQWVALSPMLFERQGCSACVVSGRLVVVGGRNSAGALSAVERLVDGRWESLADMSVERGMCPAVVIDGKIVVVGGQDEAHDPLSSVEIFDPTSGDWQVLSELPFLRHCFSVAAMGSVVAVVGGFEGDCVDAVEEGDPFSGVWQTLPPMRTARANAAFAVLPSRDVEPQAFWAEPHSAPLSPVLANLKSKSRHCTYVESTTSREPLVSKSAPGPEPTARPTILRRTLTPPPKTLPILTLCNSALPLHHAAALLPSSMAKTYPPVVGALPPLRQAPAHRTPLAGPAPRPAKPP
eukprot:EG_transcript_13039